MLEYRAFYYYDHDNYWEARKLFDSLIVLDSTKGEYYFKRAYCYDRLNDLRAVDDYKKAIQLNYRVGTVYKNLGFDAIQRNNDSLAIVFFVKAIRADSTKRNELIPWIKTSQQRIASHDAEAWKEYKEHEKEGSQKPILLKVR